MILQRLDRVLQRKWILSVLHPVVPERIGTGGHMPPLLELAGNRGHRLNRRGCQAGQHPCDIKFCTATCKYMQTAINTRTYKGGLFWLPGGFLRYFLNRLTFFGEPLGIPWEMAPAFSGVTGMIISPSITFKWMENKRYFHLPTSIPIGITRNSGYTRHKGKIPMSDTDFWGQRSWLSYYRLHLVSNRYKKLKPEVEAVLECGSSLSLVYVWFLGDRL